MNTLEQLKADLELRSRRSNFLTRKDEQERLDAAIEEWSKVLEEFDSSLLSEMWLVRSSPVGQLEECDAELAAARLWVASAYRDFESHAEARDEAVRALLEGLETRLQKLYVRMFKRARQALDTVSPERAVVPKIVGTIREAYLANARDLPMSVHVLVRKRTGELAPRGKSIFELEREYLLSAARVSRIPFLTRVKYGTRQLLLRRKYRHMRVPVRQLVVDQLSSGGRTGLEQAATAYQAMFRDAEVRLDETWTPIRSAFLGATATLSRKLLDDGVTNGSAQELAAPGRAVVEVLDLAHGRIGELATAYLNLIADLPQRVGHTHRTMLRTTREVVASRALAASPADYVLGISKSSVRRVTRTGSIAVGAFTAWTRKRAAGSWHLLVSFIHDLRILMDIRRKPRIQFLTLGDLPTEEHVSIRAYERNLLFGKLFSTSPLLSGELAVWSGDEPRRFGEAYARWTQGLASNLAVVGTAGSGKTSLLNVFASEVGTDARPKRVEITTRLTTTADVVRHAQSWFGLQGDGVVLDNLINSVNALPQSVIFVEGLHNLMLRTLGTREAAESFLYFVMETRRRHFWAVTCQQASWNQMEYVLGITRYFTQQIDLPRPSPAHLCSIVKQRASACGLDVRYMSRDAPERVFGLDRLARSDESSAVQRDLSEQFFRDLEAVSGNIRSALYFWLVSAACDSSREVIVVNPCTRLNVGLLRDLETHYLLTLAEVTRHGGLTADEVSAIFMWPTLRSRLALDYLTEINVLSSRMDSKHPGVARFTVNPTLLRVVESALEARNMLY